MSLVRLALRNIQGTAFRSWVVLVCAALLAGFAVSSTLIVRGARQSLDLALARLGADLLIVPDGTQARVETAILMGVPVTAWMPSSNLAQVAGMPGVAQASPQIYLATLSGASCCSMPDMFLMAYDPQTDFTLRPWLEQHQAGGLQLGQAVGGSAVHVPADEPAIKVYGTEVDLRGNLTPTGTALDQSMFFTLETAQEIARLSPVRAERELVIKPDSISAVLVRAQPDADVTALAAQIRSALPGVTPVESAGLFSRQRAQMSALRGSILALLAISWLLAVMLIGLVSSIAANERRREIAVLRALGSTRGVVVNSLLIESALLALAGGLAGTLLGIFCVALFRTLLIQLMGVPFALPSPLATLALIAGGLALSLTSVLAVALWPTVRISRMEPALAMRE